MSMQPTKDQRIAQLEVELADLRAELNAECAEALERMHAEYEDKLAGLLYGTAGRIELDEDELATLKEGLGVFRHLAPAGPSRDRFLHALTKIIAALEDTQR